MAAYWKEAQRRLSASLVKQYRHASAVGSQSALDFPCFSFSTTPLASNAHSEVQGGSIMGQQTRSLSNKPENTVYGGPSASVPKRVTLRTLRDKYVNGVPISMVTAYDYPSAVHVSHQGMFIIPMKYMEFFGCQLVKCCSAVSSLPCFLLLTPCFAYAGR